jgi:hypothetical protein
MDLKSPIWYSVVLFTGSGTGCIVVFCLAVAATAVDLERYGKISYI